MSATTSQTKLTVVDSEKTAKLQMANVKETLGLKRNLSFLDRSEALVVNRIRSDQKVVYKRFQKKLLQSKVAHARVTGDKDALQELLATSDGSRMNTDIGRKATEEEEDMLKKIWQATRLEAEEKRRRKMMKMAGHMGSSSARGPARPQSSGAILSNRGPTQAPPRQRPITAFVTKTAHFDREDHGQSHKMKNMSLTVKNGIRPDPFDLSNVVAVTEDFAGGHLSEEEADEIDIVRRHQERPETAPASVRVMVGQQSAPSQNACGRPMPRPSRTPSFFQEEEKRPSLLDFHRLRLKTSHYEDRVKQFCESIKLYQAPEGQATDYYYSLRLLENDDQKKRLTAHLRPAGTPTEELRKMTGNLSVRNLTFKNIMVTVPLKQGRPRSSYR